MNGIKETTEMYDFLRLKLSKKQNPKVGASFSFLQGHAGETEKLWWQASSPEAGFSMPGLPQFPPSRLQVRKASVVKWPQKQKVLAAPGTGQEALPLLSVPEGGKRVLPCEPARRHARGLPSDKQQVRKSKETNFTQILACFRGGSRRSDPNQGVKIAQVLVLCSKTLSHTESLNRSVLPQSPRSRCQQGWSLLRKDL